MAEIRHARKYLLKGCHVKLKHAASLVTDARWYRQTDRHRQSASDICFCSVKNDEYGMGGLRGPCESKD